MGDIFEERGIPPEVWKERPYERWEADAPASVVGAYESLGEDGLQFALRIAKQSSGWLIHRFPPPGLELDHIYPEFRPDEPVKTRGPQKHWHGSHMPDGFSTDRGWLIGRDSAAVCRVLSGKPLEKHVARAKDAGDHADSNTEEIHYHQRSAKYVFPRSERVDEVWSHDHHRRWHRHGDRSAQWLGKHVAAEHVNSVLPWHDAYHEHSAEPDPRHIARHHKEDPDVQGEHEHVRRMKDRNENLARRIDVHPLAVDKICAARVVFFSIEGCMKADAILSKGAAVFSVPSVSQWDAGELPAFVDAYVRGKAVVIVPDADWFEKTEVISQARLCQAALRRLGVPEVHIAAAPVDSEGNPLVGAHGKEPKRRGRFSWRRWPTRRSRDGRLLPSQGDPSGHQRSRYPALHPTGPTDSQPGGSFCLGHVRRAGRRGPLVARDDRQGYEPQSECRQRSH